MQVESYRIARTDIVSFKLLSNDGFKLVDISTIATAAGTSSFEATVDFDGTVKLPLIGRIKIEGMTAREVEQMLETRFAEFYVGPFVTAKVINKRVTVFTGTGGSARVVSLTNSNTTVFEVLALASGITEDGKAYRIKLIRRIDPTKPRVYLIDLSTINGLKDGNTVVQANDIIYVEPRNRVAQRLTTEIVPYISLMTSFLLVYSIFRR